MNKLALMAAVLAGASLPVLAHHAVSAEFDASRPVALPGDKQVFGGTAPGAGGGN